MVTLFGKVGKKYEGWGIILLLIIALLILAVKNYQLFAFDPVQVMSDISTHASRPYFYLKNPAFVEEWYNGTPLFNYYPPASIWLSSLIYALVGSPGLATSIAMLVVELMVLAFCILLARELKADWRRGALTGLIILASTISTGRFFNAGRYGEFFGFAMLLGWGVFALAYFRKPSNSRLAAVLLLSFFTMLSHFLEGLMLLAALGVMGLLYLFNKVSKGVEATRVGGYPPRGVRDAKIWKILLVSLGGALPTMIFWVPFVLQSNKPSIAGTAISGYWTLAGGLLILYGFAYFFNKYRSLAAYLIALILMAWGFGKVAYYPPVFPEQFEGLQLQGKYVAIDDVDWTVYSVLGVRGFRSPWGNYPPAASNELANAYLKMDASDCNSLKEFAAATDTEYFIADKSELERCGFKLVYSKTYKVYELVA